MRQFGFLAAAVVTLSLSLSGCFKYTVVTGTGGDLTSNPKTTSDSHFLWGLVGDPKFNMKAICASENATVEIERSFLQGLLADCTLGIWIPSDIKIYCGSNAGTAELRLSPAEKKEFVASDEFLDVVTDVAPDLYEAARDAQAVARAQ